MKDLQKPIRKLAAQVDDEIDKTAVAFNMMNVAEQHSAAGRKLEKQLDQLNDIATHLDDALSYAMGKVPPGDTDEEDARESIDKARPLHALMTWRNLGKRCYAYIGEEGGEVLDVDYTEGWLMLTSANGDSRYWININNAKMLHLGFYKDEKK